MLKSKDHFAIILTAITRTNECAQAHITTNFDGAKDHILSRSYLFWSSFHEKSARII